MDTTLIALILFFLVIIGIAFLINRTSGEKTSSKDVKTLIFSVLGIMLFGYVSYYLISLDFGLESSNKTNKQETPYTYKYKENENPYLTLLRTIRSKPFNPNGYIMLYDRVDEYGYTVWEEMEPLYIFESDVVKELRKYRTSSDFWYSDYGSPVMDKIRTCDINKVKKCFISK